MEYLILYQLIKLQLTPRCVYPRTIRFNQFPAISKLPISKDTLICNSLTLIHSTPTLIQSSFFNVLQNLIFTLSKKTVRLSVKQRYQF
jgi:hypothetical protein